ncbi:hypothetical protein CY34DRAFT_805006 [Suillus luteus UH-Slu-Lm8-n1]|uniref:Unplaced genomic scaffold CY34scaffold_110, whole genome shotgun sequence n=1 Tax=Suillus luteus UH-Slu-Lm8-n1 TaxID=930992 RepID=A0A0D0B7C7_9AGAM|nr:hypothetical protein CY34DRAFT_805006 [Suillus luteus UH-Slu-Lm8-n1]
MLQPTITVLVKTTGNCYFAEKSSRRRSSNSISRSIHLPSTSWIQHETELSGKYCLQLLHNHSYIIPWVLLGGVSWPFWCGRRPATVVAEDKIKKMCTTVLCTALYTASQFEFSRYTASSPPQAQLIVSFRSSVGQRQNCILQSSRLNV